MNGNAPEVQDPLARLAADHGPGVRRYLLSMVGDPDAAADLTQDTFIRLHRSAEQAGRALVYTVARSCALDHLRRLQTRRRHEAPRAAEHLALVPGRSLDRPDRFLAAGILRRDLLEALGELPEEQRTVFHLSEIEGLSYAEIAGILAVSPGTIASRKHHAVRRLREFLRRRGHAE